MSEPTLQDCINYMRRQIKQMEKHPRNYEFNLPYYRKTVELLEARKTNDETFEWCHDCKEYDQKEHCCHRWTKVIRDTVDELEKDRRPHGEWIKESLQIDEKHFRSYARCKICGCSFKPYSFAAKEFDFCPKCGADMREGEAREK